MANRNNRKSKRVKKVKPRYVNTFVSLKLRPTVIVTPAFIGEKITHVAIIEINEKMKTANVYYQPYSHGHSRVQEAYTRSRFHPNEPTDNQVDVLDITEADIDCLFKLGYRTSTGRFVDRVEAAKIAKEANQLKDIYAHSKSLYSYQLKY